MENGLLHENTYYLPCNVTGEVDIPFFHIRVNTRRFIEGSVMGVLAILLILLLGLTGTTKWTCFILYGGGLFFLGCLGLNDESVLTFIKSLYRFAKRKDVMLYNPEIKSYGDLSDEEIASFSNRDSVFNTYLVASKKIENGEIPESNEYVIEKSSFKSIVFEDDKRLVKKKKK